jgi:hypothetical protein
VANIHKTSRGEVVDMDMLRLSNEQVIAIGNMKTNARGDELGKGGQVVKTRAQVMQEYHKLNTPMANDTPVVASRKRVDSADQPIERKLATPTPTDMPVNASSVTPQYVKPRGSFADAVAKETEVTQELLDPAPQRSKGVSRI